MGDSGTLNCSAEGNPAPRFTWRRSDGRSLDSERFRQRPNGNFYVTEVHPMDVGKYICAIEQSKGTNQVTTKEQRIGVSIIGKKSNCFTPPRSIT